MNYKLMIYPALEAVNTYKEFLFKTEAEMRAAHETAAALLLFLQDDICVLGDFSNVFECYRRVDGGWEEVE